MSGLRRSKRLKTMEAWKEMPQIDQPVASIPNPSSHVEPDSSAISISSQSSKRSTSRRSTSKETRAKTFKKRRLMRSFRQVAINPTILAQLMKRLCSDAGSCLTFGKYVKPTKLLFNNFDNFERSLPKMKRIGTPSANGFVYEITYENSGFRAHTILKCSIQPLDLDDFIDGLYYEYLVGRFFVNEYCNKFPCFLETYGVYNLYSKTVDIMSQSEDYDIKDIVNNKNIKNNIKKYKNVNYGSDEFKQQLKFSCKSQFNTCILIQHISASDSMGSYFNKRGKIEDYYYYELPQLLYQVYAPLAVLGNTFTHYDLHKDNVLLYNLGNEKYINMNYIYPETGTAPATVVSFKTHIICKIIDYGRSYFYADEKVNSMDIYNNVCEQCIDKLNPENKCGNENGYNWFNKDEPLSSNYYILSSLPNVSHDLRLLNEFKIDIKEDKKKREEKSFIHIRCGITDVLANVQYNERFGTEEVPPGKYSNHKYKDRIFNIFDAERKLRELIMDPFFAGNNNRYESCVCVGTLNVYMDTSRKTMEFDPVY